MSGVQSADYRYDDVIRWPSDSASGDQCYSADRRTTRRINEEPVDVADLADRLSQVFRTNLNHPLFVRAEAGLEFREVAEVIDIARGAGLTRVALMR